MTTTILGTYWLADAAAASWKRMVAAGMPNKVTSAGRTRAEQQALYDRWKAGKLPGTPTVAKPGTSNHESGAAIDVPEPTRTWLHRNGAEHGWTNPAWAKRADTAEPWHFEYDPARDKHRTTTGGVPASAGILQRGSHGQAVITLQKGLRAKFPAYRSVTNGQLLTVDGDFGPATEAWTREFQRRTGLDVDGRVGPATRSALRAQGITL